MDYFSNDTREFAQIQPRTRKQRNAHKDKEAREKQLLEDRPPVKGVKYINYGRHLTSASEGTVMHITEQDRFYKDFAEEEKRRRDEKVKERNQFIEEKRSRLMEQEEQRWKKFTTNGRKRKLEKLHERKSGSPVIHRVSRTILSRCNMRRLKPASASGTQTVRYGTARIFARRICGATKRAKTTTQSRGRP